MTTSESRAELAYQCLLPFLAKDLCLMVIDYLGVFKRELVRREIAIQSKWIQSVALLDNGSLIAASQSGTVRVIGERPFQLKSKISSVTALLNDKVLICTNQPLCTYHQLEVWNTQSNTLYAVQSVHACPSAIVAVPGGWATAIENYVYFWRLSSRYIRFTAQQKFNQEMVNQLMYKAETNQLVVGVQGLIYVAECTAKVSCGLPFKLKGHTSTIFHLADVPNNQLASTCNLNKCMVWDLHSRTRLLVLDLAMSINQVVHIDGCLIFAFDERDCPAQIWDLTTGALVGNFGTHSHAIMSLIVTPKGELVATTLDGGMTFWK